MTIFCDGQRGQYVGVVETFERRAERSCCEIDSRARINLALDSHVDGPETSVRPPGGRCSHGGAVEPRTIEAGGYFPGPEAESFSRLIPGPPFARLVRLVVG